MSGRKPAAPAALPIGCRAARKGMSRAIANAGTAVTATTAVWLAVVCVYALVYIAGQSALDGNIGYERLWTFQLVFFAYSRLPWLVLALFVLVVSEVLWFRRRKSDPALEPASGPVN